MKKELFFLLIVVIGVCLVCGCVKQSQPSSQNSIATPTTIGQNAVLTSNGKSIEVNLIKTSNLKINSDVYEFIFEIRNLGEKGITISQGNDYHIWLEDYGGFKHGMRVYGYEQLADGSYKYTQKNLLNEDLNIYPQEKILIGGLYSISSLADLDKLKVKTILHFSYGDKSERTWDVTNTFT